MLPWISTPGSAFQQSAAESQLLGVCFGCFMHGRSGTVCAWGTVRERLLSSAFAIERVPPRVGSGVLEAV